MRLRQSRTPRTISLIQEAVDAPAARQTEAASAGAAEQEAATPEQSEKAGARRSTVREKVTFLSGAQPAAASVTPEPAPSAVPESAEPTGNADPADEAGAPRRAGWWSRRFGGGE